MSETKQIYFLGIGGIGMSALARYYNSKGYKVSGYDRTKTPLTTELEKEGIKIHYSAPLNPPLLEGLGEVLVIYTPAIPEDFEEFVYFKNNGFRMLKRAQVLGEITRNSKGICIAGTHGKTSTSTMVAHLMYSSEIGCTAFLGGISKNYNKNLLLTSPNLSKEGAGGEDEFVVVEADEYDRSFHQLTPHMALITAADPDHLDIYGDKDEFRRGFEKFASLVKENGYLVVRHGIELDLQLKNVTHYTYSATEGDFHAKNIKIEEESITFDFVTPTEIIENITLRLPFLINVENGVGAMAMAYLAGVKSDEIRKAMASYKGIKRRFDVQLKTKKMVFIDDYAHHPEELKVCINSVRAVYPNRKICGVFQPHLYTRTRDFQDGFAQSLSMLDEVILLDIYPAREKAIEGVSSDIIFDKISIENKIRCDKNTLLEVITNKKDIDVLLTLGAGDIDACVPKIKKILEDKCLQE